MIKKSLFQISQHISTKFLIKISKQKLVLPFYHLVSDTNPPHTRHLYSIRSIKQFESDLDFFLKYYKPLDHKNLLALNDNNRIGENSFFLSFDDGFSEIHHIVAPILERKGVPATFFVNPSFVDNKNLFFRNKASLLIDNLPGLSSQKKKDLLMFLKRLKHQNTSLEDIILKISYDNRNILDRLAEVINIDFDNYLLNERPYLSSAQIQNLSSRGFGIGAHSMDHPEYRYISLDDQIRQTITSVDHLVKEFDLNYRLFSFPFTDYGVTHQFFKNVYGGRILDLSFGTAGLKCDIIQRNLQRIPMEGTLHSCKSLINAEYLYYLLRVPFKKNLIIRD